MSNLEWSVNLPKPIGYSTFEFIKDDSSKNCHRSYRITHQPGLWSEHVIRRSWGRRGNKKFLFIDQVFDSKELALQFIKILVIKRLKRGYRLNYYEVFS